MAVVIDRASTLERGAEQKRSSGQSDKRCSTTQRLRLARSQSNRISCISHDGCHLLRDFLWPKAALSLACLDITSTPNLACTRRTDYWLQHLELVSIIPALVFGALVARYFQKVASWAWVVPTIILSYRLLTFNATNASVLTSGDSSFRFSYYFVIQRHMPTFSRSFGLGGDPARESQLLEPSHSIPALRTASERS